MLFHSSPVPSSAQPLPISGCGDFPRGTPGPHTPCRALTWRQWPLHSPTTRQVLILGEARVLVGLKVLLGGHALHQLAHGAPFPPVLGTEHSRPAAQDVACMSWWAGTLPGSPGSVRPEWHLPHVQWGVSHGLTRRPEGRQNGPSRSWPDPACAQGLVLMFGTVLPSLEKLRQHLQPCLVHLRKNSLPKG